MHRGRQNQRIGQAGGIRKDKSGYKGRQKPGKIHVRQGKNYLVDDYTRMGSLNQSPEVMDILRQMRKDLGFDRVRAYEPGAMEPKDVAFSRWKHPLKPMARKSVLKELRESHSKEAAGKLPRKHKEKGWSERSD